MFYRGSHLGSREFARIQRLVDTRPGLTREALAQNADEAVSLAAKIGGKIVLKIDSPDIAHKTEAGGVRLGVEGEPATVNGA